MNFNYMDLIIVILIILVIFFLVIKKQQIEHFGWFGGAFNSVKSGLSSAAKWAKEKAEKAAKAAAEAAKKAAKAAKKAAEAAARKIKEAAMWLANQIAAGIRKALDFLKSIPGKVASPFRNLFGQFQKLIEGLFQKVFDKIMEVVGAILEAIFGPIFEPLMPYIYAIGAGVVLLIITCFGAMIYILTRPDNSCSCE